MVQKEARLIKELKAVTPKNSLDVARKAIGIEAPVEEKKETKKEKEAKEKEAKKEVTVGTAAPASASAPAEESTKTADS